MPPTIAPMSVACGRRIAHSSWVTISVVAERSVVTWRRDRLRDLAMPVCRAALMPILIPM
jgi:hypothetical protein